MAEVIAELEKCVSTSVTGPAIKAGQSTTHELDVFLSQVRFGRREQLQKAVLR